MIDHASSAERKKNTIPLLHSECSITLKTNSVVKLSLMRTRLIWLIKVYYSCLYRGFSLGYWLIQWLIYNVKICLLARSNKTHKKLSLDWSSSHSSDARNKIPTTLNDMIKCNALSARCVTGNGSLTVCPLTTVFSAYNLTVSCTNRLVGSWLEDQQWSGEAPLILFTNSTRTTVSLFSVCCCLALGRCCMQVVHPSINLYTAYPCRVMGSWRQTHIT